MDEAQEKLYGQFVAAYHAWANAKRPYQNPGVTFKVDFLTWEQVQRLGGFRDVEWRAYIAARDRYLAHLFREQLH